MSPANLRTSSIIAVLALGGLAFVVASLRGPEATTPHLPPLRSASSVSLPIRGAGVVVVVPPVGARAPRPLVLVVPSADTPVADCSGWRRVVGPAPFIVCPEAGPEGITEQALTPTLQGALRALKARWPRHVAPGPVVLVGSGPAAHMASMLATQEPSFFSRLVLLGIVPPVWTSSFATVLRRRGAERVLLACDTEVCATDGARTKLWMQGAGLEARLVESGTAPSPALLDAVSRAWPWLVEGDARWLSAE